jgi:hypothetical protein
MQEPFFVCADRYKIALQEAAEEALAAKSLEVMPMSEFLLADVLIVYCRVDVH